MRVHQNFTICFFLHPSVVDDKDQLNENVMQNNKQILELTNSPYNYYDKSRGLKVTRWIKFSQIIKPLMTETKLGDGIKKNNTIKAIPLPKKKLLLIILSMCTGINPRS